jgi:predicted lipoprotein
LHFAGDPFTASTPRSSDLYRATFSGLTQSAIRSDLTGRLAMSTADVPVSKALASSHRRSLILAAVAVFVVAAMGYDTKIVRLGSGQDSSLQEFSPDKFGQEQFPRIQDLVTKKAVEAQTLGAAVLADKAAAAKQYGVESTTGVLMPVRLVGLIGEGKSGVYDLKVDSVPDAIHLRVQTGPAINGTDLRDAPGDIKFGQFKNQIEYQDAGSGINRAMKKAVLDPIDVANLSGKSIDLVGVFRLINPKNWMITPVKLDIK